MRRIAELEPEIGKLKAGNQNLVKKHLLEMRNKDSKELRIVSVVCVYVLVYACVALITRAIMPLAYLNVSLQHARMCTMMNL
jgi:hypothetical protein